MYTTLVSLPIRERGLKSSNITSVNASTLSLPIRERGLKSPIRYTLHPGKESLPIRERGLKSISLTCVGFSFFVAPHTGAWIEIDLLRRLAEGIDSRSPYGSVD